MGALTEFPKLFFVRGDDVEIAQKLAADWVSANPHTDAAAPKIRELMLMTFAIAGTPIGKDMRAWLVKDPYHAGHYPNGFAQTGLVKLSHWRCRGIARLAFLNITGRNPTTKDA